MRNVIQFMGMTSDKYGSIEKFNEEVAKQLYDRGFKTFFVYNEIPTSEQYVANLQQFNAEIVTLSINWGFWKKFIAVLKILLKYKPKIVHCHFSFPLIRIVIALSWLLRVPKRFITIHSMPGNATFIGKCSFKFLNIFSSKIFTVSDTIRNKLTNNFHILNKIETLRLGIDINKFEAPSPSPNPSPIGRGEFSPFGGVRGGYTGGAALKQKYGLPNDKFIIGCVAFHQAIKGVDVLLDAISILKHKYQQKDFVLCQVGYYAGKYADSLIEQAKTLNIEDVVIWLGLQDNVPEILKTFDVYCQPSRSEGLPLSVMESLAAKLPTVATNVGGTPEIIEDNVTGLLVESENSKQMAEKILLLKNDIELCEKLKKQGYEKVTKEYNKTIQVEKLIDKYLC